MLDRSPDWRAFLVFGLSNAEPEALRSDERTGRPLDSSTLVARLERLLCRMPEPHTRDPKRGAKRANARDPSSGHT